MPRRTGFALDGLAGDLTEAFTTSILRLSLRRQSVIGIFAIGRVAVIF